MRHNFLSANILIVTLVVTFAIAQTVRPPAVPLVTHDPYFSIWSMTGDLNASPTRHWTGKAQRLAGLVRIDGNVFRWMGDFPRGVAALPQTSLKLTATHSVYQFAGQGVSLEVDFLSPVLPSDPDVMSARHVHHHDGAFSGRRPAQCSIVVRRRCIPGRRRWHTGGRLVAFPAQRNNGFTGL